MSVMAPAVLTFADAEAAAAPRPFLHRTYEQWLEWRTCKRKQAWPSQMVADNWIILLRLHYGAAYMPGLTSYDCRFCRDWHVGHGTVQTDGADSAHAAAGVPLGPVPSVTELTPSPRPGSTGRVRATEPLRAPTPPAVATDAASAPRLTSAT